MKQAQLNPTVTCGEVLNYIFFEFFSGDTKMERNVWNASSTKSDTILWSGEPVKQTDNQKFFQLQKTSPSWLLPTFLQKDKSKT